MAIISLSVLSSAALMLADLSHASAVNSKVQSLAPAINSIFSGGAKLTPQILQTFLEPIEVLQARNSYVYRDGTTLRLQGDIWTANGANVYWLGLDENVIPPAGEPFYAPLNASYPTPGRTTEVMNTLVMMGASLIRSQTLGVSVGNPLSLMPSLGVYNDAAFEPMDWAVFQARQHGLRILPPLTDDYDYYHGGKFNFLRWRGFNISGSDSPLPTDTMQFYTNKTIIQDFKDYIEHLMTHVNPLTGLTYAEDPTIIGYETGNELNGIKWADQDVPNGWTSEICQLIKKLGPNKLCIDGTYGVNSTHFAVPEVDIFSNHYYPLNNTILSADIAAIEKANRVYLVGEIGWKDEGKGDSLASFYNIIQKREGVVAAGSVFWSLFGHDVPNCEKFVDHSDGFTLQYGNSNNSASVNSKISIIRQHYFAMQNITVDSYLPAVPCPDNYIPGYEAQYTYA
ncbi:Glycoside hydrolase family 5 protein [Venustampulla echinocandica]|uniref:mannan endo-1,4-beta-mannosidase n=1 Tax=Venustampulla echinocandica TaxID=2656787 RepID=A0A370U2X6_9HELO|nr:Glycoside hydrolase family 5 protein [Venustampulla echinocandica]RDL42136.1 Glycoside hydrolase family 5 protein [Venustampulla echinocandica]